MSTGSEFERGALTEKVREHDRRLAAINGSIDRAEAAQTALTATVADLALKVEGIGVKVAMYAAIAAGVAGIAGSVVAAVIAGNL